MKKLIISGILIISCLTVTAQMHNTENQSIDSLLSTGRLNADQSKQLYIKWGTLNFPEFIQNKNTGEIEISDTITLINADRKSIFQRCLEWIAINYGNLAYSDLESGKIIAHGLLNLNNFDANPYSLELRKVYPIQTPVNYTMILTIKDNKFKYTITNITYSFIDNTETMEEISYPISSIYLKKSMDHHWIKYLTALTASREMFWYTLKNSLINYINDKEKDYQF
jgi:hypothetical protein